MLRRVISANGKIIALVLTNQVSEHNQRVNIDIWLATKTSDKGKELERACIEGLPESFNIRPTISFFRSGSPDSWCNITSAICYMLCKLADAGLALQTAMVIAKGE